MSYTNEKELGLKASIAEPEIEQQADKNLLVLEDEIDRNASGHHDQLRRHYGLLSICGLALTIDNAWVALGGSLTVSICMLSLLPHYSVLRCQNSPHQTVKTDIQMCNQQ